MTRDSAETFHLLLVKELAAKEQVLIVSVPGVTSERGHAHLVVFEKSKNLEDAMKAIGAVEMPDDKKRVATRRKSPMYVHPGLPDALSILAKKAARTHFKKHGGDPIADAKLALYFVRAVELLPSVPGDSYAVAFVPAFMAELERLRAS